MKACFHRHIFENNYSQYVKARSDCKQEPAKKSDNADMYINRKPSNVKFTGAGAFLTNGISGIIQIIETNGFAAEFTVQDVLGFILPRVYQGYNRNREELGHPNYKAATEEGIREFTTGSSMFLIPAGVWALSKKVFGSGASVQLKTMNELDAILKQVALNPDNALRDTDSEITVGKRIKKGIYNNIFDGQFLEHCKGSKQLENETSAKIAQIVDNLVNIEKNQEKLSKIRFFDLSKRAEAKSLKKEISTLNKEIVEKVAFLNKSLGISVLSPFKIGHFDKNIQALTKDLLNYSGDTVNKIADALLENHKLSAEKRKSAINIIETINLRAKGARNISNTLAIVSVFSFFFCIPKLYQRNKNYPGLDGLVPETGQAIQGNTPNLTGKSAALEFIRSRNEVRK